MSNPSIIRQYLHKALNIFYPRNAQCVCCGNDHILTSKSVCSHCLSTMAANANIRYDIPLIKTLAAPFEYEEPIRSLVHQFKYDNKQYLARFFAEHMVDHLPMCDVICPVPLHPLREKERGYSQTNLICMELSQLIKHRIDYDLLIRVRHTPSQTALSAKERKLNLQSAFQASSISSSIQSVCLIDDIATTGATLQESAKALYDIGIKNIYACVIAY